MCSPSASLTGGSILGCMRTSLFLKGISYLSLLLFGQKIVYVVSFSGCLMCSLNQIGVDMLSGCLVRDSCTILIISLNTFDNDNV